MNLRIRMLAAAMALVVIACSPAGESISARIGPAGGVLESVYGGRVLIPAGALEEETQLTLTVIQAGPERLELFLSPTDTRFQRDVAVEVRFLGEAPPSLFRFESGVWMAVPDQRLHPEHRLLAGKARHAGEFVAAPPTQVEDAGCPFPPQPEDGGVSTHPVDGGSGPGGYEDAGSGPGDDQDGGAGPGDDQDGGAGGGEDGGTDPGEEGDAGTPPGDEGDGGTSDLDGGAAGDGYNWSQGDGGWSSDPWSADAGWYSEAPFEGCVPPVQEGGLRGPGEPE